MHGHRRLGGREDMSRQMERPAQVNSAVDFIMKNRLEIFPFFGPLAPQTSFIFRVC